MLKLDGTTGISVDSLPFLVGQVCFFAMPSSPNGFLFCDGREISRSTYAALFNAIGTLYGSGNGSTTFNLPDLRGEFIRGWDAGRGADTGRGFGSWQDNDFKWHGHGVNDPGHAHSGVQTPTRGQGHGGEYPLVGDSNNGNTGWGWTGISIMGSGGNETRPRNVALYPCIFTKV